MNCTPAGMDGGMFVTLTQHMNFEGLVNDGAWMATELKLPYGTWTNPDNEMVATATSWALLLPAYGVFQRLLSRSFIARGFVEEAFVGRSTRPMIEMGGTSQYGGLFGMAHFECAAAGSGALAIKDGLDTAYVGWNPESDMGNIEVWEQYMPMIYIGRSIVPNSGGAGKYRGGCSFESTWLVNKTNHLRLVTSEHSSACSTMAECAAAIRRRPARSITRCATPISRSSRPRAKPLAHAPGTNPHRSDFELRFEGKHEIVEGPYITAPHKIRRHLQHSYNGGGGYGDVLERDPVKTAWDVENGYMTPEAAPAFSASCSKRMRTDIRLPTRRDRSATARKARRGWRKARPVSEWMASSASG